MQNSLIRSAITTLIAVVSMRAQSIPVVERTLSNGMRVLLLERHDVPTISAGWVARVGSANEHTGATGLAHLFEHMMFKGTVAIGTRDAKRDAELNEAQDKLQAQIREELALLSEKQRRGQVVDINDPTVRTPRHRLLLEAFEKLVKQQREITVKDELDKVYSQAGAKGLNANTTNDRTFFHITVPANKLELWAWLESDRLLNARFREFYSERDVVLEERRQRTDSTPTGKIMEAFTAMVWEAHPYHWPVLGWPSDISQVTREQANEFFATYYAPNNLTAVIVGDFRAEKVWPVIEKYFGRIPSNPNGVPKILTTEPVQVAEQRMVAEAEATPMIVAAFKAVPTIHRDAAALDMLAAVLNGRSGRLHKILVMKDKVATGASAEFGAQTRGGLFYLEAVPVQGRSPEEMEPLLYSEVEKIARDGVGERELQKVKNQMQAGAYARMESNDSLRNALAEADAAGSYMDFLEEPAKLQAVTNEDLQRVAREYFRPENRSVLILHRKKANGSADQDLETIPTEARPMVQAQLAELGKLSDVVQVKQMIGKFESNDAQAPAESKHVFEFLLKKLRQRIQSLETK